MIDKIYDVKLGELFKERRKELRLRQPDVAEKLGLSTPAVCLYEAGKRCMTWDVFKRYCDVLKLKPSKVVEQVFDACKQ